MDSNHSVTSRGGKSPRDRSRVWGVAFGASLAVLFLLVPSLGLAVSESQLTSPAPLAPTNAPVAKAITGKLLTGNRIAVTPSSFWALNIYTTCSKCITSNAAVGTYLNASPFTWFRYSSNGDACNVTSNTV